MSQQEKTENEMSLLNGYPRQRFFCSAPPSLQYCHEAEQIMIEFESLKRLAGPFVNWLKAYRKKNADLAARITRDVLQPLRPKLTRHLESLEGATPFYTAYNEGFLLTSPLQLIRDEDEVPALVFAEQQTDLWAEMNSYASVLEAVQNSATVLLRHAKSDPHFLHAFRRVLDDFLSNPAACDEDKLNLAPINTDRKVNEIFDIIVNRGRCSDSHICYRLWLAKGDELTGLVKGGSRDGLWEAFVHNLGLARARVRALVRRLKAIEVALYKEGFLVGEPPTNRENRDDDGDGTTLTIF